MSQAISDLRARYLQAQLAGDRREALRIVIDDGLGAGIDVRALQTDVIQTAQQQIGIMWQRNEVSIAQEHMATAISQLALAALFERAPHSKRIGRTVLVACVEGELHDLPARLVADLLDLAGFDVRFIGASVPHDHLVHMAEKDRPDVVGLSVTMSFNLPSARTAIARLQARGVTKIFVGGHATTWSRSALAELGVEVPGNTPEELVATARSLAGVS